MKYLITGITGQDGIHLTNQILKNEQNSIILGTSRNSDYDSFLNKLGYLNRDFDKNNISLTSTNLQDYEAVKKLINEYEPNFIFNLSGPSSVYGSHLTPEKTYKSITNIFNNLTKTCIELNRFCNFFQPSSSEMFKDSGMKSLTEDSQFLPLSPYAEAKLEIHMLTKQLRDSYDWNISSGILFNHESEFRDDDYLFMKIINSVIKIKNGDQKKLIIGSLDLIRDWSYAKDVTMAMYTILNERPKSDYIIGSGLGHSIKDLVDIVFKSFNLRYEEYVDIDPALLRKQTPKSIISSPQKIRNDLGWVPKTSFEELVDKCIKYKLNSLD
ncbi:GDP-mannose 4,6-dehydratase [Acidimicrobiia bacterium]|nr:GDP-mannose 4,6-dehydratase [Acidimicrobiia bacterium]